MVEIKSQKNPKKLILIQKFINTKIKLVTLLVILVKIYLNFT